MTTTAASTENDPAAGIPPWKPRGRPDRWAAGLLAATLGLLAMSYAFGLLAPRIDTAASTSGLVPGADDLVYAHVVVSNTTLGKAGVLPDTRLVGAGRSLPGLHLVWAGIERSDATYEPLALDTRRAGRSEDVPLPPGASATVMLVWRVTDCALVPTDPPAIPLVFRTPLGLTRSVDARGASWALGASDLPGGQFDTDPLSAQDSGWARGVAHFACTGELDPPSTPNAGAE